MADSVPWRVNARQRKLYMEEQTTPHNPANCSKQLKDTVSLVASTVTSVRLVQGELSPDEFDCFDLRCYVQPVPVITGAMFQKPVADASDDDNSYGVHNVADVVPHHRVTLPNSNRCSFSYQLSQLSKASLQEGSIVASSSRVTLITMLDKACHRRRSLYSITSSNTSRTVAKKRKTHSPADDLSPYPR
jgi:hypothetical protein